MTDFQVRDAERVLSFTGHLLASVSTEKPSKERWFELRLYRTVSGNYVIERVGRSTIEGEEDRCSADISETCRGVLESLYFVDDDGVWFLSRPARELLQLASAEDPDIAAVYENEQVD